MWISPCLALAGAFAPAPELCIEPRRASWEEAARQFDPAWIVPRGGRDLVLELERLAAWSCDARPGDDALARARSLGDLAELLAPLARDARGTDRLLARLERERPELWDALGRVLGELVRESWFQGNDWDPDRDRKDDGFLIGDPRDLAEEGGTPLARGPGSRRLVQVATLIRADLVAIKEAENDFRTWPARPGARYEWIRPEPDSYLRGDDGPFGPWASLRVDFRTDLPFPFSHYDVDLRMLHRLDERGRLESHVAATGEDFHWLAGHDVHLPLSTSDGRFAGLLCVRVFGTDLDGVPDRTSHHEEGARQGLGGLKREAERRWRARGQREAVASGSVPAFQVWAP